MLSIYILISYVCSDMEKMNILKQKLMDIYYLTEDSEELHGVTDCYNKYHDCDNIASIYCENNLCKLCCEVILI